MKSSNLDTKSFVSDKTEVQRFSQNSFGAGSNTIKMHSSISKVKNSDNEKYSSEKKDDLMNKEMSKSGLQELQNQINITDKSQKSTANNQDDNNSIRKQPSISQHQTYNPSN